MMHLTPAGPGFGIYIHWPFCKSKCPYCDFNSHVRATIDESRWRRALLSELDHYAARTGGRDSDAHIVTSIFFGGGTPSLMHPETVAALIARVRENWRCADDIEITLEANPTSVEAGRFGALASSGVNRVSLGLQALDDAALKFLGRTHSTDEGLQALDVAQRAFGRVSFDLIYARPGHTVPEWRTELARAIARGTTHLSLYQLTIEPGTVFEGAHRRGEFSIPDEETGAALYEATQEICEAAGLPAYEVSNHARPGEESRHNLTYWRYGDYVGVGPGAHGRISENGTKFATRQHRAPEAWLAAVEADGHATRQNDALDARTRLSEMTMMGLRLGEGLDRARLAAEVAPAGPKTNEAPADLFDPGRLAALVNENLLEADERFLRATPAGRQRLNALTGYLLG
jgi:putative oxygen-independent coproporphyrinogen III oxidase